MYRNLISGRPKEPVASRSAMVFQPMRTLDIGVQGPDAGIAAWHSAKGARGLQDGYLGCGARTLYQWSQKHCWGLGEKGGSSKRRHNQATRSIQWLLRGEVSGGTTVLPPVLLSALPRYIPTLPDLYLTCTLTLCHHCSAVTGREIKTAIKFPA